MYICKLNAKTLVAQTRYIALLLPAWRPGCGQSMSNTPVHIGIRHDWD